MKNLEVETDGLSLIDVPREVFQNNLFPYLRTNEILRVRRLCKWTNFVASDYLRLHPRSRRSTLNIRLHSGAARDRVSVTLKTFLKQDKFSVIRMPCSNFHFDMCSATDFQHPLIPVFLEKYGKQVKHLRVDSLSLPMNDKEFLFYSNLPNLTHLDIRLGEDNSGSGKALAFPETFRNLKVLKIPFWVSSSGPSDFDSFEWKLFGFCQELVHYQPSQLNGGGAARGHSTNAFTKLRDYLEAGNHKKLRILDLFHLSVWTSDAGFPFAEIGEILCELAERFNLSLSNIAAYGWGDRQLERLLCRISSVEPHGFSENSFTGRELQNVTEMYNFPWNWELEAMEVITATLTQTSFPALKKLSFKLISAGASTSLEHVWRAFPQLEYISLLFEDVGVDDAGDDLALIGTNPDTPAFLQLTCLKELVLKMEVQTLTDVVFFKVLRHMRLQKFFIESTKPVCSFTSSGIRALLKGHFMETIEDFPFHAWRLKDLKNVEFLELARQFPNNQNV